MSLRFHGDQLAVTGQLDFAVSVWPGARPPALHAALLDALDDPGYPDSTPAKRAVAARHGRHVEDVMLVNGACDAFWLIAQALRPRSAACIHPSFTEPEAALRAGVRVGHVYRDPCQWEFDPARVPETADLVVLGNPNNPTGSLDRPDAILSLARPGRTLVVDESFMDFVPGDGASLAHSTDVPGLIVVRSLSKLWSLAGIRAGYMVGPAEMMRRIDAARQPWSVNALACAAIAWCAADRRTPPAVAHEVSVARSDMIDELSRLPGLRVWPSVANFLLVRGPETLDVPGALAQHNVIARPAASFPGLNSSYFRVAVRSRQDNAVLLQALHGILS